MALLNSNYLKLKGGYLFPEIQRQVEQFQSVNPSAVREAMHRAVDEMGEEQTFRNVHS